MKLYQQLILFMVAATVLPLALVGFWVLRQSEAALAERLDGEQRAVTQSAAEGVSTELTQAIDSLGRSAELIDWSKATPDEIRGGASLFYGGSALFAAVAIVSPQAELLAPIAALPAGGGGHRPFDPQLDGDALRSAIALPPLLAGGKGQVALSRSFRLGPAGDRKSVV